MVQSSRIISENQKQQSSSFLKRLRQGSVCVHPTDTVPGLTCDPLNSHAVQSLELSKKRTQKKALVGLVPSLASAFRFWQPLDPFWTRLLTDVWPQSLTCIWKAGANVPSCLVSDSGELALRYPRLHPRAEWFYDVMEDFALPLPSTSINYANQSPILGGVELEDFSKRHGLYLPELPPNPPGAKPSSLIRILDHERYEILREGALSSDDFSKIYSSLKRQTHESP